MKYSAKHISRPVSTLEAYTVTRKKESGLFGAAPFRDYVKTVVKKQNKRNKQKQQQQKQTKQKNPNQNKTNKQTNKQTNHNDNKTKKTQ